MSDNKKRNKWTQQEDNILKNLVKNLGIKKWNQISQQLKELSKRSKKTPQQCKERWSKHLSPKISKTEWVDDQVKIIFDKHRQHGNKWTEISKFLIQRSDNDVKNHFYNALRKGVRKICKILNIGNSTQRVKKIKPTDLSTTIFTTANSGNAALNSINNKIYDILFQFSRDENYQELKKKASNQGYKKLMRQTIQLLLEKNQQENSQLSSDNGNQEDINQQNCSEGSSQQQQQQQSQRKVTKRKIIRKTTKIDKKNNKQQQKAKKKGFWNKTQIIKKQQTNQNNKKKKIFNVRLINSKGKKKAQKNQTIGLLSGQVEESQSVIDYQFSNNIQDPINKDQKIANFQQQGGFLESSMRNNQQFPQLNILLVSSNNYYKKFLPNISNTVYLDSIKRQNS